MKQFTLKSLLLVLTILMGGVNAWGEEGSLTFGTNNTKINSPSVTASDNLGNSWTITTVGTTSFTEKEVIFTADGNVVAKVIDVAGFFDEPT